MTQTVDEKLDALGVEIERLKQFTRHCDCCGRPLRMPGEKDAAFARRVSWMVDDVGWRWIARQEPGRWLYPLCDDVQRMIARRPRIWDRFTIDGQSMCRSCQTHGLAKVKRERRNKHNQQFSFMV